MQFKNAPPSQHNLWLKQKILKIISLLENHNIPAKISNDCGTHLCNKAFYNFLHWREINNSEMKVGFVHIGVLPKQVIKYYPEAPFMTMDMIREALSLIISKQIQTIDNFDL